MFDLSTLPTCSESDLAILITAAQKELAARATAPIALVAKRVAVHYNSYNGRRYSRPWIARVTSWPVGGRPELEFGRYLGDEKGGDLELMAKPGDILRDGQKDGRGNGGTNDWEVVLPDYTTNTITQAEARELYRS
jgi:hypothetical protein